MEEGIFVESDVYEHGLETLLDVLDFSFKNTSDDVLIAFALDGVFFEKSVFEQRDTAFEFFDVDKNGVSFHGID